MNAKWFTAGIPNLFRFATPQDPEGSGTNSKESEKLENFILNSYRIENFSAIVIELIRKQRKKHQMVIT